MNGILIVLVLFTSVSLSVRAQTLDPEARRLLQIEDAAKAAVEAWNPRFTTYGMSDFPEPVKELFTHRARELPMAVRGDFNGDGAGDYAFMGHDARRTYVVFALKLPRGYRVVVAHTETYRDPRKSAVPAGDRTAPGLALYIGLAEKEEIGMSRINSAADVLFIENYGGTNDLYQVKGEKPVLIPELFGGLSGGGPHR